MIELGIGADIVRGVVLIYWLVCLGFAALALWLGTSGPRKVVYALLVVLLFVAPGLPNLYRSLDYRHKYAKAKALFDERCKTAGEKVYRTVEGVDGILLLKVRPEYRDWFSHDPMYAGAALFGESGGDDYIKTFLKYEKPVADQTTDRSQLSDEPTALRGYRYVDVLESSSGARYRYSATMEKLPAGQRLRLERASAPAVPPRYALTYEDEVDPADRRYWVAGTTAKIIDTTDNTIVATSTWYAMEPGQGSAGGGRQPWAFAQRCPRSLGSGSTRYFVDQVLHPIREY